MKDDQKTKVTVDIYGQRYTIVGQASSEYLEVVAQLVDQRMNAIAGHNPSLDTTRIAVLTSVNLADEYNQLKQENEELLQLIEEHRRRPRNKNRKQR